MKNEIVDFDYYSIKTFEDACKKENIEPTLPDVSMIPEELRKPVVAYYKLMVIYKAINNGWEADLMDSWERKHFPVFEANPSDLGFSFVESHYEYTSTYIGVLLFTDTQEKAIYIAKQFESEYNDCFSTNMKISKINKSLKSCNKTFFQI